MSLTNSQHDKIMQIYDDIRSKNRKIHEKRVDEVNSLSPEYQEIKNAISDISVDATRKIILSGFTDAQKEEFLSDVRKKIFSLDKKKTDILKQLNKPADYLEPIFDCDICKDTGYVNNKKCECFKKKSIDLIYEDSNLKNLTAEENFDTFNLSLYSCKPNEYLKGRSPNEHMASILTECKSFVHNFDTESQSFVFTGKAGVGKTFLSNCIAGALIESTHSVIYLTAASLFDKMGYELPDSNILECDLLIIDDLGTELANAYTASRLFHVINERLLRDKSTIISTNLSVNDIRDRYTDRVFSRLLGAYKIRNIIGNDLRVYGKF